MTHIIFYSGGIGSYFAAKRIIHKYGKENVVLLFTDTLIEDEDLYRFIEETAQKLEVQLIRIADGRTPWEVAKDVKFIPNSRIAQCSHILKQKTAEKFIKENYKVDECILYLGIDWTESHRTNAPVKNWAPYTVEFPMMQEPYIDKGQMLVKLEKEDGITAPRLYKMGFAHNNCGGFCFRAGVGHFKNLLDKMPDRYLEHETKEQEMRKLLERDDVSILRRTRNGQKINITLTELREELTETRNQISYEDLIDIGGCGCFVSEYDENQLYNGMGNDID